MKDDCECTKDAGVCEPCDRTAMKTITDVADYARVFIDRRFPEGLPDTMRGILTEVVLDAFHDGARYSESTIKDESRIIVD
jgi:hypothetical protein